MADKFDAKFIEKVKKNMNNKVAEVTTKISLNAMSRLIQVTPVDYGQARAGWNLSYNEKQVRDAAELITGTGSGANSKKESDLYGAPKIPDFAAQKIGDFYHITNSVQHIVYLNEGTSVQAPTNFIDIELAQSVKDVGA